MDERGATSRAAWPAAAAVWAKTTALPPRVSRSEDALMFSARSTSSANSSCDSTARTDLAPLEKWNEKSCCSCWLPLMRLYRSTVSGIGLKIASTSTARTVICAAASQHAAIRRGVDRTASCSYLARTAATSALPKKSVGASKVAITAATATASETNTKPHCVGTISTVCKSTVSLARLPGHGVVVPPALALHPADTYRLLVWCGLG